MFDARFCFGWPNSLDPPLRSMAKVQTQEMPYITRLCFIALLSHQVVSDCGPWSDWTACSVTCGTGQESRTRKCVVQEPGKELCGNEPTTEAKKCKKTECPAKITFEKVGCYKEVESDRALPDLVADLKMQVDWKNLNKTIQACAQLVHKKGWSYFGLQDYGLCYSGLNVKYSKHGKSTNCWKGLGKTDANFVYKFN